MPNVNLSLSVEEIRGILIGYGFNIYMYGEMEYAQKGGINLPLIKAFRAHFKQRLSSADEGHTHSNKTILDTISFKITESPTEPENPSEGDIWIPTN